MRKRLLKALELILRNGRPDCQYRMPADVGTEQRYVSMLYERLDRLRQRASG